MKRLYNTRASTILFSFLLKNKGDGMWMIPVNICHLIPACFIKVDCPFEIIDVSKRTLDIDQDIVLDKLKKNPNKYSGILTVRNFGEEKGPKLFYRKIKKQAPHVKIIDDACLGYPDFNSQLPQEVNLELYSTGYSKAVDIGYGGFGKIHDDDSLENITDLNYDEKSLVKMNQHYIDAMNDSTHILKEYFKSNWLNSESINVKMYEEEVNEFFPKAVLHKTRLNKIYDDLLLPKFKEKRLSANWRYNLRLANPDFILEKINQEGLFASQHYYPLNKVFTNALCPEWETAFHFMLNLFNDFRFNEEKAKSCCKIINHYAKEVID